MVPAAPAMEVRAPSKNYWVPKLLCSLMRGRIRGESVLALDRISFCVALGEVRGLPGPAGTTTLINILCALLTPTAGEDRVADDELRISPEQARMLVGLVTSNERSFYGGLTGRQIPQSFAALYRVPEDEANRHIADLLDALDVADFADRPFDSYSTGTQQRFAFARALLHKPRILFVDESTKGINVNACVAPLRLMQSAIGSRDVCCERDNVTREKAAQGTLRVEETDAIRAHYARDIEFYEFARQLMDARIAAAGTGFGARLKRVRQENDRHQRWRQHRRGVRGWLGMRSPEIRSG